MVKNKMVPMGDYFYEIALEDVEFMNLLASYKFGEVLLPNDRAVSSSLFCNVDYRRECGRLALRKVKCKNTLPHLHCCNAASRLQASITAPLLML